MAPIKHKARLLLLPLAAAVELLFLGISWLLAAASPAAAKMLIGWVRNTLPDLDWYLGHDDKQ